MRMVIAGGGTGGHVFPGISVADEFRRRLDKAEIFFIGTEHGIEARAIPKAGYPLRFIPAEGFIGKSPFKKLRALIMQVVSVLRSRRLLKAIRPDIVIGTGGYASLGPLFMAYLMSIPTLIIEHNIVPGLANRVLGRFVDAVSVTYHESISAFPKSNALFTGTPIRRELLGAGRDTAIKLFGLEEDRFTVLVLGGSSGSRSINNAMVSALNHLIGLRDRLQFLHQSGEADFETVRRSYRAMGFKGMAAPFIHEMAEAYAVADLVISRAGATTLAEITALGKPAILVPYPHAAGHQEFNAKKLVLARAALMIEDHALSGEALAEKIKEVFLSGELRTEMKRQSLAMGMPDATERVVDIAMSLVRLKGGFKA